MAIDTCFVGCRVLSGLYGAWYVVLNEGERTINYDQLCFDWYYAELSRVATIIRQWLYTRTCPCDLTTVNTDIRWIFDSAQNAADPTKYCYYERSPIGQASQVGELVRCVW